MVECMEKRDRIPVLVNGVARIDQNSAFLKDTLKTLLIYKKHQLKQNV
jgi:hypothetical protein